MRSSDLPVGVSSTDTLLRLRQILAAKSDNGG